MNDVKGKLKKKKTNEGLKKERVKREKKKIQN